MDDPAMTVAAEPLGSPRLAVERAPPGARPAVLGTRGVVTAGHERGSRAAPACTVLLFYEFWTTRIGTGLGPSVILLVHVIFLSRPLAARDFLAQAVLVCIGQDSSKSITRFSK